jgi:hypothetical protein
MMQAYVEEKFALPEEAQSKSSGGLYGCGLVQHLFLAFLGGVQTG